MGEGSKCKICHNACVFDKTYLLEHVLKKLLQIWCSGLSVVQNLTKLLQIDLHCFERRSNGTEFNIRLTSEDIVD